MARPRPAHEHDVDGEAMRRVLVSLPDPVLAHLKREAAARKVPYQALLRALLADALGAGRAASVAVEQTDYRPMRYRR